MSESTVCSRIEKRRVAVVYHFFAHYRAAIMQTLLASEAIDYFLISDLHEPSNEIEAWEPPKDRWRWSPCFRLGANFIWQKGLLRLAMQPETDAIIFLGNANFLSTWCSAGLARLLGKRVLFWTHGWVRDERGLKRLVRNLFYRLAHGLLLYGNRAKAIGIRNGFPKENLYVIYNSLDYRHQSELREAIERSRLSSIRNQFFKNAACPVLICTGRLNKLKRIDLLLDAMFLLLDEGLHTSLLLVGEGPEEAALRARALERGLSVHFFGACYEEERLAELIMSANLTVSPGQVGLTAMHSLAYGVPVVTHDDVHNQMPESEAIVPGKTGDLFRHGDVVDLAEVLKRWIHRPWPDATARQECIAIMERFYNPQYQANIIARAVAGCPAEGQT
ncbi:MAG: glycosyltransferase [Nitrospira sp.]|jgi:glycosyltransferase involved in cell wall biosynthesis|nr:glycosyltransferase [Nitrospira sp.]